MMTMTASKSPLMLSLAVVGALAAAPAPTSQAASLRPDIAAGVERTLDGTVEVSPEDGIIEVRGSRTRLRSWR